MISGGLIYEDAARYDGWIRLFFWVLVACFFVAGFVLLFLDTEGAYTMFGAAVFIGLLLWAILPRGFQVFEDRVRIVLGGPFAWAIPLADIEEISAVSGSKGFIYQGVRLATSLRSVVEIRRRRGTGVVFSPSHADEFIEQVERARGLLPSRTK